MKNFSSKNKKNQPNANDRRGNGQFSHNDIGKVNLAWRFKGLKCFALWARNLTSGNLSWISEEKYVQQVCKHKSGCYTIINEHQK